MGQVKKAQPVKLFVGMLFASQSVMEQASQILTTEFGKIDSESALCPFEFTDYYREEMGNSLWRKFIAFESLVTPEQIVRIKLFTNRLEAKFFRSDSLPSRPINLDPGYLSLSKVILATTKDYSHRIYLDNGIYAEVTLRYHQKAYRSWEWTYPDYRSQEYLSFFHRLRQIYREQLRDRIKEPK